jgi:hypothetical protein
VKLDSSSQYSRDEGLWRELRAAIACGDLAHGYCRVRCSCCALDLLVAFSCKGGGICPSCGGRRMPELAAHLVDEVLPDVPTRQWVLTMPIALRLHPAADPDLLRDVACAFIDAVFASYVRGARAAGLLAAPGAFAYPGAVPHFLVTRRAEIWFEFGIERTPTSARAGRCPRHGWTWPRTDVLRGADVDRHRSGARAS